MARDAKVTVAVVGRRWGKTFFGVNEQAEDALDACVKGPGYMGPGDYGWIAPSYKLANIAWAEHDRWFWPFERSASRSERCVELVCGCRLWFLSADNPTSVRGRGFRKLKVDEGAWISKSAYENAILPTLADSDGPMLAISTPSGRRGWVYEEFNRAAAVPPEPGYVRFQRPSWDLLDLERGADAAYLAKLAQRDQRILAYCYRRRRTMSPVAFDQEHGAMFTEDAAALFKGIDGCIGGAREKPAPEAQYVMGVDLGKSVGRTAAEILRLSGGPPYQLVEEVVMFEVAWPKQARALADLAAKWNHCPMTVDAGGVGAPVCDMLREMGAVVRPIVMTGGNKPSDKTTSVRKVDLLDNLAVAIADAQIRIPSEMGSGDGDLRRELDSFATEVDDEGSITYESRSGHGGGHGDRAIALALAWHGAPRRRGRATIASGKVATEDVDEDDESAQTFDN